VRFEAVKMRLEADRDLQFLNVIGTNVQSKWWRACYLTNTQWLLSSWRM